MHITQKYICQKFCKLGKGVTNMTSSSILLLIPFVVSGNTILPLQAMHLRCILFMGRNMVRPKIFSRYMASCSRVYCFHNARHRLVRVTLTAALIELDCKIFLYLNGNCARLTRGLAVTEGYG